MLYLSHLMIKLMYDYPFGVMIVDIILTGFLFSALAYLGYGVYKEKERLEKSRVNTEEIQKRNLEKSEKYYNK